MFVSQHLLHSDPVVTALMYPALTWVLLAPLLSLKSSSSSSTTQQLLSCYLILLSCASLLPSLSVLLCSWTICYRLSLSLCLTQTLQERACLAIQSPASSRQSMPQSSRVIRLLHQVLMSGLASVVRPHASVSKKHLRNDYGFDQFSEDLFHSRFSTRLIIVLDYFVSHKVTWDLA